MSSSLFSPSWYRVAELKPRLRSHGEIHRHHYRGQLWFVLQDHASGRFHRLTPATHYIVALLDGSRTVQEAWEMSNTHLGEEAPTQQEIIQLLGQLHASNLLQCNVSPDTRELFRRYEEQQKATWKQRLRSPLAVRIPIWDPDRFLDDWLPIVRPFFGWMGAVTWLGVVACGLVLAAMHWVDLTEDLVDRVMAPHNLLLLWLIYPLIKTLHELGHAFATKVWGGEVHEMGIMLLVLMPVPYVDASAASAFREKRKRVTVDAAGILVELFVAAIALFVWLNAEPGLVRLVAYNVMLIGGVSTLFFNGNPLLRFDGYYILADAVEIPNLATRANRYLGYLIQRYGYGLAHAQSPVMAPGESHWFVGYGILSFVYRVFIVFSIVLFIAGKFFLVGVLLAIWAGIGIILMPLLKNLNFLLVSPRLRGNRVRALMVSTVVVGILSALLLFAPAPFWTRAEGVVWVPEQSLVRAGTDGFILSLLSPPDSAVGEGDPLIELEDPFLSARVQVLESRLQQLRARYQAQRHSDRVAADITAEKMEAITGALTDARERVDKLTIRSPANGRFVVPKAVDLPGRYLHHGELVAYVLNPTGLTVRVVVPQADVALVRQRTESVAVKFAERIEKTVPASMLLEVPAATGLLPSMALATVGGGEIAIDPRDPQGTKALEQLFQFELDVPSGENIANIGERVYVRFSHGSEPIAKQWYRAVRQLFLRRFRV